jgi:hypothetical protein
MTIIPRTDYSSGSISGLAGSVADLARRVSQLETIRSSIGAGTLNTGSINLPNGQLSDWTNNLGVITAGELHGTEIFGGVITGATFQTSDNPSVSRVVVDTSGIRGSGLGGIGPTFNFDTATGIATLTGVVLADPLSTIPVGTLQGFIGGGNLIKDSSFESTDPALPHGIFTNSNGVTAVKSQTVAFHGGTSLKITGTGGGAGGGGGTVLPFTLPATTGS